MATPLNGAAWTTFSMPRWLIRLPLVARRSPAMTTPSAKRRAMQVVACGCTRAMAPGVTAGSPPRRRNSSGKLEPGSSPGRKIGIDMWLLATLLHVGLDEVLGIRLEDVVDLVEQVVHLRLQLVAGGRGGRSLLDRLLGATRRRLLLLCSLRHGGTSLSNDSNVSNLATQSSQQLEWCVTLVDQPSDHLGGAAQWFHHRHPAQRF